MSFIQTLPFNQLDIIGDIHGQFDAFQHLLHYLGYREDGHHPLGRKIVLVGDLIDRGPDSPAVLAWFRQAWEKNDAYMVLGNHELNLLNQEAKEGSGWFFDSRRGKDDKHYAPWQVVSEAERKQITSLLQQQPLILQRHDLRIIHAAWLPESIAKLQASGQDKDIVDLCRQWDDELDYSVQRATWFEQYLQEQRLYAAQLEDIQQVPPMLEATSAHDVFRSSSHPIRALVCGVEKRAIEPFFASGRWRFSIRYPWWDDYEDDVPVVIGHYWRQWQLRHVAKYRAGMFTVPAHHWHGKHKNVFCIDFSVGARWRDRQKNISAKHSHYRLAALRWPEKMLVFDNGDMVATDN